MMSLTESVKYSKEPEERTDTMSEMTYSDDDDSSCSFDSMEEALITPPIEKEVDWEFWSKVISNFDQFTSAQSKRLSTLVAQGGIPSALRGTVWSLLTGGVRPESYLELLGQESVYEKAITRDLHRTFPNHPFFQSAQGQESLFNVVKAYSNYDREVGYCQGLAFVAGPLLLNMPEEEAFGTLVRLLEKYDIRKQFTPQMDLLLLRLYQFDGLLEDRLPHLYRHFNEQGIRSNIIYDLLFLQGVNCLFAIGLALLAKNQANILSLDFDHLVTYLKEDMLAVYQGHTLALIEDAGQFTVAKKRLDQLAKAFHIENTRADHEACQIARLKTENRKLTERYSQSQKACQKMQAEHAQVAQELTMKRRARERARSERGSLIQKRETLRQAIAWIPERIEARVHVEMHRLCKKNQTLTEHNARLQDQLADTETLLIEIKLKYAHSESERECLSQRLTELKKWMNSAL